GVVDRVVDQIAADRGFDPWTGSDTLLDSQRNIALVRIINPSRIQTTVIVRILFLREIIGELRADIVGDRQAETDRSAGRLRFIFLIITRASVDIEARGDAPAQEIGLGEGEAVVARILAAAGRQADELAAAEEVALGDGAGNRGPGRVATRRIAGADGELAGRFLDHVHHENDLVRLGARCGRNIDPLKIIKLLKPLLRA